jgi:3-oxoacyl-[acyl-carrier protein] reductase
LRTHVLVTGGGRGIGRAIALRFAREPSAVVLAARTRPELEAVAREVEALGSAGLAVPMDVADLAAVERGMASALEFLDGRLDVLVNNAGVFTIQPFRDYSPATWYRMLAVNLNGPFHVTLLGLKGLERSARGHVFQIASTAGRRGYAGSSAYCASKYGLRGFADALRLELADQGIRVSTVYPGATDTRIFDGVPGDWDRSAMNTPEEVAEVVWSAYWSPPGHDVADLEIPPPARPPAR